MRIDSRDGEVGFGVDIERSIGDDMPKLAEAQLGVKELEALRMREGLFILMLIYHIN